MYVLVIIGICVRENRKGTYTYIDTYNHILYYFYWLSIGICRHILIYIVVMQLAMYWNM